MNSKFTEALFVAILFWVAFRFVLGIAAGGLDILLQLAQQKIRNW